MIVILTTTLRFLDFNLKQQTIWNMKKVIEYISVVFFFKLNFETCDTAPPPPPPKKKKKKIHC